MRLALAVGAARALRPVWARAGTVVPRPAVAFALVAVALAGQGGALLSIPGSRGQALWLAAAALGCGVAALGDLAATCIGDSVTVERRPAAFAWLDVGQGLGCAAGLALGVAFPRFVPLVAALALLAAGAGILDLRDRGTPRSSWPLAAYAAAARAPIGRQLAVFAFCGGTLAAAALALSRPGWIALPATAAGMIAAARLEPRAPNAVLVPRGVAAVAALSLVFAGAGAAAVSGALAAASIGAAASALPSAVARGAAEMERAPTSSLVWSALSAGAGAGVALAAAAW